MASSVGKRVSITLSLVFVSVFGSMAVVAAPDDSSTDDSIAKPTKDLLEGVMGEVLPPPTHPDALPEKDSAGAKLVRKYCAQCHELPGPGLHTADEWPTVVGRMFKRLDRFSKSERDVLNNVMVPEGGELSEIINYLSRHGYKPIDIANYPDIDTDIGKAFRQVCSTCHALPDPSLHDSDQWKEVVLRMRENMRILGVADPGDDALAKAMSFLQSHAASGR